MFNLLCCVVLYIDSKSPIKTWLEKIHTFYLNCFEYSYIDRCLSWHVSTNCTLSQKASDTLLMCPISCSLWGIRPQGTKRIGLINDKRFMSLLNTFQSFFVMGQCAITNWCNREMPELSFEWMDLLFILIN